MSALAAIVGPPIAYVHAHKGRALVAAAVVLTVAGWLLTGPHGRRS